MLVSGDRSSRVTEPSSGNSEVNHSHITGIILALGTPKISFSDATAKIMLEDSGGLEFTKIT